MVLLNKKTNELADANVLIASTKQKKKLAQANEKLSFIGKYVSSNPIDVLYTLNYAGFTTSLYMLSIAFSIAVDAGLSINTATLLAVSTVLKIRSYFK